MQLHSREFSVAVILTHILVVTLAYTRKIACRASKRALPFPGLQLLCNTHLEMLPGALPLPLVLVEGEAAAQQLLLSKFAKDIAPQLHGTLLVIPQSHLMLAN
jgi:hypothetical protein